MKTEKFLIANDEYTRKFLLDNGFKELNKNVFINSDKFKFVLHQNSKLSFRTTNKLYFN